MLDSDLVRLCSSDFYFGDHERAVRVTSLEVLHRLYSQEADFESAMWVASLAASIGHELAGHEKLLARSQAMAAESK